MLQCLSDNMLETQKGKKRWAE